MTTEFIKDLIQRQLLIQEAKKEKLDEEEPFRQTIQRYWESTLIRDLMAKKGEEFRKITVVTPEEIDEYYLKNKEFLGDGDFDAMKLKLAKTIEDNKVAEKIAAWIEELKSRAEIEIKDAQLAAKLGAQRSN